MRKPVAVVPLLLWSFLVAGCATLGNFTSMLGSQVTFTQPQLQHALNRSFPRTHDAAGGLLSLRLTNPSLSIPYSSTRMRLSLDARIESTTQTALAHSGRVAFTSGLRYDPATRALYLEAPRIEALEFGGGSLDTAEHRLVEAWLADYARRHPVYQLDDTLALRVAERQTTDVEIRNGVVVMDLGQ